MLTKKQIRQYEGLSERFKIPLETCLARLNSVDAIANKELAIVEATYDGMKKKCVFIDAEYGEWLTTPANVLRGRRHPKRTNMRREKTNLDRRGCANPMQDIEIRNKFTDTMIKKYGKPHALQVDGFMSKYFDSILKTQLFGSKFETEIQSVVGDKFQKSYLGGDRPIEIDLLHGNIGIECHGDYWHTEQILKERLYHKRKMEKARAAGIQLVQIFQSEWKQNPTGVANFLKAKAGVIERKIHARKTKIEPVSRDISEKFCKHNHIQGSAGNYSNSFGFFLGSELLGVVQIGKGHRQQNSKETFLRRMCFLPGVQIVGGVSKISNFLVRKYTVIYTFVDYRFSYGESYMKSGWALDKNIKPDYWYYDITRNVKVSKQERRKKRMKTENMTEKQHAENDGLFRIWDAGKGKLVLGKG